MFARKTGNNGVTVTTNKNSLYIYIAGKYSQDGKRIRFSTGLSDNAQNWAKVFEIQKQIEADLESGSFDTSFNKYKAKPTNIIVFPRSSELTVIFREYIDFKRRTGWSENTYTNSGMVTLRRLEKLECQDINQPIVIRDELLKLYPNKNDVIFRTLRDLGSCVYWLIDEDRAKDNKYPKLAKPFKPEKKSTNRIVENTDGDEEWDINPFTSKERDLIIQAFADNRFAIRYKDHAYSQYLAFLGAWFYTGMRTGEILGLTWKDVKSNKLDLHQSRHFTKGGWFVKEGLKTQRRRSFPINEQLRQWLDLARSLATHKGDNDFIFQNFEGNPLHPKSFTDMWTKCLAALDIEYRRPYQCRHTFITLAVRNGGLSVDDAARICGTSPEMIRRHYLGNGENDLLVPTL